MPPRRREPPAVPSLTDADVAHLRDRLSAGDQPRVVVRTASAAVAAGTRGSVIRLGDPRDGDYVVVRLGRDEVPFAPAELSLAGRAGRLAAAAAAAAAAPVVAPPTPRVRAARPASTRTPPSAAAPLAPLVVATTAAPPARPVAARPAAARRVSPATPPGRAAPPVRAAAPAPVTAAATRRPRTAGRRSAPLTVTLRFADGSWSAEASRGASRVARPAPVRPSAVSALAEHIDDDALRTALVDTVESCRLVVEERAEALRAELAAAEAALRAYDPRSTGRGST